jgi:SIR2-like domain
MISGPPDPDPSENAFRELVRLSRVHKDANGICVFLGAGCSLSSSKENISTAGIIARYLGDRSPGVDYSARDHENNFREFVNSWLSLGTRDRNDVLARYIPPDMEPSAGYINLARLVAAGTIKAIITTNFDNLIDKALQRYGVDYVFHCGDRAPMNPTGRPPIVTLVKVHGGLHQCDLSFSPDELDQLPRGLARLVRQLSSRTLLVVGYSGQDRGVMKALSISLDHTAFWASPTPPSRSNRALSDRIFTWLDKRVPKGSTLLFGPQYGIFDALMESLFEELNEGGAPPVGLTHFRGAR